MYLDIFLFPGFVQTCSFLSGVADWSISAYGSVFINFLLFLPPHLRNLLLLVFSHLGDYDFLEYFAPFRIKGVNHTYRGDRVVWYWQSLTGKAEAAAAECVRACRSINVTPAPDSRRIPAGHTCYSPVFLCHEHWTNVTYSTYATFSPLVLARAHTHYVDRYTRTKATSTNL